VDEESPRDSRFWLNADRAAEDERAVRAFLRGKGRGIDGSRFRAFVRDCRRRVGPGPVFEPDINMTLEGVLYDWGVWFRPRLTTETAANAANGANAVEATWADQRHGIAVPARPHVDTVATRDSDDAPGAPGAPDEESDSAVAGETVRSSASLAAIQTVIGSSGRPAAAPSPSSGGATAPPPAAAPTQEAPGTTRSVRSEP
jgi:hypothetical protein